MIIERNIVFFINKNSLNITHIKLLRTLACHQDQFIFFVDSTHLWWVPVVPFQCIKALSSGSRMADVDDVALLNKYRRNRSLLVGKASASHNVVLCNEYSYDFVSHTLKKQLENGSYNKRHLSLLEHSNWAINSQVFDCRHTQNSTAYEAISQRSNNEICRPVSPRSSHSTTVAVLEYWVAPFTGTSHRNELRRNNSSINNETTQYSISETDSAGSVPSQLVPNGLSRYKSIINKNTTGSSANFRNKSVANQSSPQQREGSSRDVTNNAYYAQHQSRSRQNNASSSNVGNAQLSKPPRHPDYASRNTRLVSYESYSWPMTGKPDPATLTKWGFFATGTLDLVRCFQCGIGLKDWTTDDDVMTEHIKHSSDCTFLLQELGPQQLTRLKNAILYPDLDLGQDDLTERTSSPAVSTRLLPYSIRHPRYQTMESRLASFQNLPTNMTQTHQRLAIAGFFFTGKDDICRCFTCDGGLQRWTPEDDPIVEHAKYFPTCNYIRQLKGEEFVRQAHAALIGKESEGATGGSTAQQQTNTDTDNAALDTAKDLKGGSAGANKIGGITDPLRTPAAQAALDTGYSKHVVQKAIEELEKQGKYNCTAEEIINEILDNESKWTKTTSNENDVESNTDPAILVSENERLKNLIRCMLCLTGETDILCLPCTHHRVCHDCAKDVTNCPACGHRIQEKIRTYMS